MPYRIRKVNKKDCYRVTNTKTKKIFAKCTKKDVALKQISLLRALEYNPSFTPLKQKTKKTQKKL